jgi:MFS family permease
MQESRFSFYYGYIVVGSAFVIMMTIWGTLSTFGVFFDSFIREFGWSRGFISGASSTRDIAWGLACVLTAKLAERFGLRIVVGASGLILGLGFFCMSQISQPWHLYIFYGFITACGTSAFISILSVVAGWFERQRGMMTAVVFSGMGMGVMIMPPIANRLISIYEWREAYLILAIIGSAPIFIAAQFLKPHSPIGNETTSKEFNSRKGKTPDALDGLSFKEAVNTKQFWFLSVLYFFFLYFLLTISVHIVIHANDLNIPSGISANILAIIGGVCVVGMNIAGGAADKIGNRGALTISFSLMVGSFFVLLMAGNVSSMVLFAIIFGLAYGGIQVLFSPLVAELFGLHSHSVILGTSAFTGTLGAALGPFMAGYIFDLTGSYKPALVICAMMSVLGIFLASRLKPAPSWSYPAQKDRIYRDRK